MAPRYGLHQLWEFSGDWVYRIGYTPHGTRLGCNKKIFWGNIEKPLGFLKYPLGYSREI